MKIFITGLAPKREQYKYVIKTAIILTASNYARIKTNDIFSSNAVDDVTDYYVENFNNLQIFDKITLREFIKLCSELLMRANLPEGFSLFCINLINKKLSLLFTDEFKKILDAPLNRDELQKVTKRITKMSDLSFNKHNYCDVMNDAENYAISKKEPSLFEWELKEYNK